MIKLVDLLEYNKYNFKHEGGEMDEAIPADNLKGDDHTDSIDNFHDYVIHNLENDIDKLYTKYKQDYKEDYNDTIDLASQDLATTFYDIVRDVYASEEKE